MVFQPPITNADGSKSRVKSRQTHAVKSLWKQMGRHIGEDDATERVGHSAQLTHDHEISGAKDGVNAGRPGYCKLKRSNRLSQPDEPDRQRVGEHGNTLTLQRGDISSQ